MKRLLSGALFVVVMVLGPALKNVMADEPYARVLVPWSEDTPLSSAGYAQDDAWPLENDGEPQSPLRYVQWGSGGERTVKCESQSDRYAYCRTYTTGRVRLQRQLSDASCRQYEAWGTDGDGSGIWVRNGCRGIFVVGGDGWGGGGGDRTISCKSESFQYQRCPIYRGKGRVSLRRQLSDASCVRGSSWGVDRDGIWVDHGCAAEFTIR